MNFNIILTKNLGANVGSFAYPRLIRLPPPTHTHIHLILQFLLSLVLKSIILGKKMLVFVYFSLFSTLFCSISSLANFSFSFVSSYLCFPLFFFIFSLFFLIVFFFCLFSLTSFLIYDNALKQRDGRNRKLAR